MLVINGTLIQEAINQKQVLEAAMHAVHCVSINQPQMEFIHLF